MADQDMDVLEDVELLESDDDNARALTSGLVIVTTVALALGWVMMEMALGKWFGVGPFA